MQRRLAAGFFAIYSLYGLRSHTTASSYEGEVGAGKDGTGSRSDDAVAWMVQVEKYARIGF